MQPMTIHQRVLQSIIQIIGENRGNPPLALRRILRQLLIYRRALLIQHLGKETNWTIPSGPLAGLKYLTQGSEGEMPPKLCGSYESELNPIISIILQKPYERIINIGCAEGFYAVGLARKMPGVEVIAFDLDPQAQLLCRKMADLNGVGDQLTIRGECTPEEMEKILKPNTLVLCDCEGAETDLLDPATAPSLLQCDVLVELHDFINPELSTLITGRFKETHDIELIANQGRNPNAIPFVQPLEPIEKFIAVWEGRPGATPWAYMTRK